MLYYRHKSRRREEQGLLVMKNFVSIALTVVNTKSAATCYETMIAYHCFTGSDVVLQRYVLIENSKILIHTFTFHPTSTRLATNRNLTGYPIRQLFILCSMVDGHRNHISASEVCKETDTNADCDVSGAPELARTLLNGIKAAYSKLKTSLKGA